MYKISTIDKISLVLVIIGAINWGFIGICNLDLVKLIFGFSELITRTIYILVFAGGINLVRLLYSIKKSQ